MITIKVYGPPLGVNKLYVRRRGGQDRHLSVDGRNFKTAVEREAARMMAGSPALDVPTEVRAAFFWPTWANDIDGPLKPVLDSLQKGGVIKNDNGVHALHVLKGKDPEQPRLEVQVRPLTEAGDATAQEALDLAQVFAQVLARLAARAGGYYWAPARTEHEARASQLLARVHEWDGEGSILAFARRLVSEAMEAK